MHWEKTTVEIVFVIQFVDDGFCSSAAVFFSYDNNKIVADEHFRYVYLLPSFHLNIQVTNRVKIEDSNHHLRRYSCSSILNDDRDNEETIEV